MSQRTQSHFGMWPFIYVNGHKHCIYMGKVNWNLKMTSEISCFFLPEEPWKCGVTMVSAPNMSQDMALSVFRGGHFGFCA